MPVPPESHFSLQNIPFGVFSPSGTLRRHVGTAIGEHAVSLTTLAASGLLSSPSVPDPAVFSAVRTSFQRATSIAVDLNCFREQ